MQPSTRTPEGDHQRCPICGNEVRIDPTRPPGDAPCPHCGALLWFDEHDPSPLDSRVASLWQRANSALAADRLELAELCLRRAIILEPANDVLQTTLTLVRQRLLEANSRRRRKKQRHHQR